VHVFADGVGRALIPVSARVGLFRRENIDKPRRERVEFVSLLDMPVQAGGVELGQEVDVVATRVYAVAYRNIYKPVFARQRNGGFAAVFCERIEARAPTSAHDYAYYVLHCLILKISAQTQTPPSFLESVKNG